MRAIPTRIPTIEELRLPPILRELTRRPSGLILVTGADRRRQVDDAGGDDPRDQPASASATSSPSRTRSSTCTPTAGDDQPAGDGADTNSFENALRAVLREDPDVILVGELRDLETISAAITLAETGHLVFAHAAHPQRAADHRPHRGRLPAAPAGPDQGPARQLRWRRCWRSSSCPRSRRRPHRRAWRS